MSKISEKIKQFEIIVKGDETAGMAKRALSLLPEIFNDMITVDKLLRDLCDSNHKSTLKLKILLALESKTDDELEEMLKMIQDDDYVSK